MNTTTATITEISNSFTGYSATIRTKGNPSVATVKKHLRKAKASDCRSTTTIYCDGEGMNLADLGRGLELVLNGQRSEA